MSNIATSEIIKIVRENEEYKRFTNDLLLYLLCDPDEKKVTFASHDSVVGAKEIFRIIRELKETPNNPSNYKSDNSNT